MDRPAASITLVGASKQQPLARMRAAFDAGLRTFGENRVQEARGKASELPAAIDWHLLGPLQSNKARDAVALFSTIHSIDRTKIARAVERQAERAGKKIRGFLEVNLGGEASKHGFEPSTLAREVEPLAELEHLELLGLMAIPPWEESPAATRRWFARLRELRDQLFARSEWSTRPGCLSMGMSTDFEIAIEEGATHVRVGTDLFGERE